MSDYSRVAEALSAGADPAMLCTTCPWDRYCITPPEMTKAEIDKALEDAKVKDEESRAKAVAQGKEPGMPMGMLLTAVTMGGRDTQASCCPVFVLRLKTSQGRSVVDTLKAGMQSWDDSK